MSSSVCRRQVGEEDINSRLWYGQVFETINLLSNVPSALLIHLSILDSQLLMHKIFQQNTSFIYTLNFSEGLYRAPRQSPDWNTALLRRTMQMGSSWECLIYECMAGIMKKKNFTGARQTLGACLWVSCMYKQSLWNTHSCVVLPMCMACLTPSTETFTFHPDGILGSIIHQRTVGWFSLLLSVASPHHFPSQSIGKQRWKRKMETNNRGGKFKKGEEIGL